MGASNHSVGRVGALAVALGIGSAVMGFAATAVADTGDQTDSTGQQASRPSGAASKARAGTRRSAQEKSTTPAAAAADAEAGDAAGARAGAPATRTVPSLSVTRRGNQGSSAFVPAAVPTSSSPQDALLGALATPGGMQDFVQKTAISFVSDLLSTAMNAVSEATTAPETGAAPAIESAPVVPEAVAVDPPAMTAEPDPLALMGAGGGDPGVEPLAWAAAAVARQEDLAGATPEVAAAAAVTTAAPPEAADVAATTFTNPVNAKAPNDMGCKTLVCTTLNGYRAKIQNDIAAALTGTNPKEGTCKGDSCDATGANYVAAYAFNVVYGLMASPDRTGASPIPDGTVGNQIVALCTQPEVLTYISKTVADNPALVGLPPGVAATLGNAVATFVQNSLGNKTVADAFVPFLRGLKIPYGYLAAPPFAEVANAADKQPPTSATNVFNAILKSGSRAIDPDAMKAGLVTFFQNQNVLTQIGTGALTPAINVLLGLSSATWKDAPSVPSNAIAGYIGQMGADALLGPYDLSNAALATTIGNAVTGLITSPIGNTTFGGLLATQAGIAFVNLVNAPGQNVPTTLATYLTSATDVYIQEHALNWPKIVPPFGELLPLLPALAPAAGSAVTTFVTNVLSTPGVVPALGDFVNVLIPGMLGNAGVQDLVGDAVAAQVAGFFGDTPLGLMVGAQVGDAVSGLVGDPAVSGAATAFVNTLLGDFLNTTGVIGALAGAAGDLATADLDGTISTKGPLIEKALGANPVIYNAVDGAVTDAVGGLLTDGPLWTVVDSTLESLVIGLLADTDVENALQAQVASEVSKALGGDEFADLVGAGVGTLVANLVADPSIEVALPKVFDTLFSDFFGYFGVDSVLSTAAGELAAAAVNGTWDTVYPQVRDALKTNGTIDAAAGLAVGGAVMELLGTASIWTAVDTNVTDLVNGLLADTDVQNALSERVALQVSELLGGGFLGITVGDQVGDAVVSFVTDPLVSNALLGLVDSVFSDFFGYTGVIDAFGEAADILTVDLLVGEGLKDAAKEAGAYLKGNADVDQAVGVAVGDAVALALGDLDLWKAADTAVTTLVNQLLGDNVVQAALSDRISEQVSALLGGGQLGALVGPQVGDAVVALLADPIVSGAILGLVDTVAVDFFSSAGVVDAFSAAADGAALDWLGGDSITEALAQASAWLKANAAIEDGVGVAVGGAVTQLLTDKQLWQTVDGAATALVTTLLGDTDVQTALSATIAAQVAKSLGGGAVAQTVGVQIGAAVVGLLANPVVSGALLSLVGSVTQTFFSATGVVAAFSNTADQAAIEVVSGSASVKDALQAAEAALLADPSIQAAIQATVSDALSLIGNTVLTNTQIQQALGSMVKSLFVGLASSPDVQAYVEAELGPLLSGVVTNLLDNPAVAEEAATALGAVVTQFMTYPGFTAALTDALGTFADGVLRGTPTGAAIGEALAALQSSPPFVAAVNAIVPGDINTLLGYTDVQDAIGNAAQQETVAALHNAGINIGIVDWIAGQFAKGAVESLLNRQPALDLVDAVTVNVLLGMPFADVTPFITQEALSEPMLQIALGLAVGQGIGAIFGENIVGDLIGLATGVPVALGVVLIAGVINVYEWMFGKPNGAAAFAAQATDSHYFEALPAATDLYVLNAILPDWEQIPGGQFTVTGLATA